MFILPRGLSLMYFHQKHVDPFSNASFLILPTRIFNETVPLQHEEDEREEMDGVLPVARIHS